MSENINNKIIPLNSVAINKITEHQTVFYQFIGTDADDAIYVTTFRLKAQYEEAFDKYIYSRLVPVNFTNEENKNDN